MKAARKRVVDRKTRFASPKRAKKISAAMNEPGPRQTTGEKIKSALKTPLIWI
jgi:hypothetical protein